jgi:predicted helicase
VKTFCSRWYSCFSKRDGYGEEFHRLGFSQAVSEGLLSDYKVMVLAVDEKYISKVFQSQLADDNNEINLRGRGKNYRLLEWLSQTHGKRCRRQRTSTPMRRAVAFSGSIKDSKRITDLFTKVINGYHQSHQDDDGLLNGETDHVDGKHNIPERNKKLDGL